MLHAFTQNKSRLYQRYRGIRDGEEKRIAAEDEITSLIFSPLAFLPDVAIGEFWRALVEYREKALPLPFPDGVVSTASMDFWLKDGIEPDLVVRLHWPCGASRTLIVELKWRSPLSPPDQLQQQWTQYLSAAERASAYHLFIAPDVSAGESALSNDVWNGRLMLRPWHQVADLLNALDGPLQKWARQACAFLKLLHIAPFSGFSKLAAPELPEALSGQPFFWAGFSGFDHLTPPNLEHYPCLK
jgi:hypothetical protein